MAGHTQPQRGTNDKVKRPKEPPTRSWDPEEFSNICMQGPDDFIDDDDFDIFQNCPLTGID